MDAGMFAGNLAHSGKHNKTDPRSAIEKMAQGATHLDTTGTHRKFWPDESPARTTRAKAWSPGECGARASRSGHQTAGYAM